VGSRAFARETLHLGSRFVAPLLPQPFRALFTAAMICVMITSPVLFGSAAAQVAQHGVLPSAMFTITMISLTATSRPSSQSPTQITVLGMAVGVRVAVRV
jgi:hypothetical protein